ncbi:hypothetical protein ABK040_011528 [Willaertia magna]
MKKILTSTPVLLKKSSTTNNGCYCLVNPTNNTIKYFHISFLSNEQQKYGGSGSFTNLDISEELKKKGLDPKNLKNKKLKLSEIHKILEENIQAIRGGRNNYDGSEVYHLAVNKRTDKDIKKHSTNEIIKKTSIDKNNNNNKLYERNQATQTKTDAQANELSGITGSAKTWYDYNSFIENADRDVFNHYLKQPTNANTSGWLYNKPPTSHLEFMNSLNQFTDTVKDWREGKLAGDDIQYRKMMEYQLHQLPQFKSSPPDPFANDNQQFVSKISYKNPYLLSRFISEAGRITPRRFTGVRRNTHAKLQREIKKARFLGIFSFSGATMNQTYPTEQYSRMTEQFAEMIDNNISKGNQVDNTKFFLDNLAANINTSGDLSYEPPVGSNKSIKKYDDIHIRGHRKVQLEKKKALMKEWMIENKILEKKQNE